MKYAFIFQTPGCHMDNAFGSFQAGDLQGYVVGVTTLEEACDAARLVRDRYGVEMIDLCAYFYDDRLDAVQEAVGPAVSVDYIRYYYQEAAKVDTVDWGQFHFMILHRGGVPMPQDLVMEVPGIHFKLGLTTSMYQACQKAEEWITQDGTEVIELCRGFNEEDVRTMMAHLKVRGLSCAVGGSGIPLDQSYHVWFD